MESLRQVSEHNEIAQDKCLPSHKSVLLKGSKWQTISCNTSKEMEYWWPPLKTLFLLQIRQFVCSCQTMIGTRGERQREGEEDQHVER